MTTCICEPDRYCLMHGDAAKRSATTQIRTDAQHAIRQQEAVPGMPSYGPYPATNDEVADELVTYIHELDSTYVRGLVRLVRERLEATAADPVIRLQFANVSWQDRWNNPYTHCVGLSQSGSSICLVTALGVVYFDLSQTEGIAAFCRQMEVAISLLRNTKSEYDQS